jgi:tyrosyl-tRNA synthetase
MKPPGFSGGFFLVLRRRRRCRPQAKEALIGVRNDGLAELFARTTEDIVSLAEFKALLESGRKLKIKFGADLAIVGSDQLFNESMGRLFQEREGQSPQVIITTRITPGLDGVKKQSKTLGNFVAIDDGPREMFGKAMSLPDRLTRSWLEVYTLVPQRRIDELCGPAAQAGSGLGGEIADPRGAKAALAFALVERWHGWEAARAEADWFDATFSRRDFPADAPVLALGPGPRTPLELLSLAAPELSRSELRRLIAQDGVELDGRPMAVSGAPVELAPGQERLLRIGRRRFFKVKLKG